jgi:hypothetical protein
MSLQVPTYYVASYLAGELPIISYRKESNLRSCLWSLSKCRYFVSFLSQLACHCSVSREDDPSVGKRRSCLKPDSPDGVRFCSSNIWKHLVQEVSKGQKLGSFTSIWWYGASVVLASYLWLSLLAKTHSEEPRLRLQVESSWMGLTRLTCCVCVSSTGTRIMLRGWHSYAFR